MPHPTKSLQYRQRELWNAEYNGGNRFMSSWSLEPSWAVIELKNAFPDISVLQSNFVVLDLACGIGRNSIYLLNEWKNLRIIGIDFCRTALAKFYSLAKHQIDAGRIILLEQDLGVTLPIASSSVDLILDIYGSINLFHEGRVNLRNEMLRVLVPGGLVLVYATSKHSDFVKEHKGIVQGHERDSVVFINGKFEKLYCIQELQSFYSDMMMLWSRTHLSQRNGYSVQTLWALFQKK